jgi:hypothetical protein
MGSIFGGATGIAAQLGILSRTPPELGGHGTGHYPEWAMSLSSNGERPRRLRITEHLSNALGPSIPARDADPDFDPARILPPSERKAAMNSLDATELKWSKAGLILSLALGVVSLFLINDSKPAKVTTGTGKHKVTHLVPLSGNLILLAVVILVITVLGFVALRLRKRTLVAFSFFIVGLAFANLFLPLGVALIALGGWLMLRAYRINKYGTANTKMVAKEAAARPPRRERKVAATTPVKPTGYKAPKKNARYTPPAPRRKKVPKEAE